MWRSGEWRVVLIFLEIQCNEVSCTDGGCISDSLLAYLMKIPPAKDRATDYTGVRLEGPRKSKKTVYCPGKNLLVSQEGHCSKERVNERISPLIISIFI